MDFSVHMQFVRKESLYTENSKLLHVNVTKAQLGPFGVRPFGVFLLVTGFDDYGPQLYQVDSYFSWKALAMGKNVSNVKIFLEKSTPYADDMELDDAVHTAILMLKEGEDVDDD
ncbi:proteasome subunit alpha type-2-like [Quercus robur]|uniref:proteasome subunit alpha type-2-like n=1 Tax=Quercus robur TaxID=38942 RepID=UPI0021633086|nr:proteasome subunit alpha type-2-like [Quercus robur]